MNRLHNLGLCIGYNRIMRIVTDLGNTEIQRYTERNLVRPTNLNSPVNVMFDPEKNKDWPIFGL